MFLATALALVGAICSVSPVRGDNSFFWAEEVGGNVVFYHQTSIDLTGFPAPFGDAAGAAISPEDGAFVFAGVFDVYNPVIPNTNSTPFGTGSGFSADSSTGSQFAISGTAVAVPPGYVSHTPISGSMTFLSTTLALRQSLCTLRSDKRSLQRTLITVTVLRLVWTSLARVPATVLSLRSCIVATPVWSC